MAAEAGGSRGKRPVGDPIIDAAGGARHARLDDMLKQDRGHGPESATGGPAAGRTTIAQARRQGIAGWLQMLGPGLITGASDDDPSGIGTYSQVGAQFGYGILWMTPLTLPLMAAVQELCGRIALQTGVGLGVSLRRKFPTWLVGVCILALVVANTINIGADLGAVAAGGSQLTRGAIPQLWLVIPAAALVLGMQLFVTYATIFRIFKWLTLVLFAYVVAAVLARPNVLQVAAATFVPHLEPSREFVTAVVAVLGTTISPYLFFWQASSEVDEMKAAGMTTEAARQGVRLRELHAARIDILVGMIFAQVIMYAIIVTTAATLHAHGRTDIATADQAAEALAPLAGQFAFILFAIGIIGTGLLAIPILSGSATYALKEFMGWKGGLALKPRYRPTFYLVLSAATIAGVLMNFVHLDPIRALFWTAVTNGVVAPPLLVLIVLLGSDVQVMKSKVSGRLSKTLTWATAAIMGVAAVALLVTIVLH